MSAERTCFNCGSNKPKRWVLKSFFYKLFLGSCCDTIMARNRYYGKLNFLKSKRGKHK